MPFAKSQLLLLMVLALCCAEQITADEANGESPATNAAQIISPEASLGVQVSIQAGGIAELEATLQTPPKDNDWSQFSFIWDVSPGLNFKKDSTGRRIYVSSGKAGLHAVRVIVITNGPNNTRPLHWIAKMSVSIQAPDSSTGRNSSASHARLAQEAALEAKLTVDEAEAIANLFAAMVVSIEEGEIRSRKDLTRVMQQLQSRLKSKTNFRNFIGILARKLSDAGLDVNQDRMSLTELQNQYHQTRVGLLSIKQK